MLQNGLHWMSRLLPSDSEILLQGPRKGRKYCLSGLVRFHRCLFFCCKKIIQNQNHDTMNYEKSHPYRFDCFAFVWCEWKPLPQLKPIGPVASSISAHIRILRKIAHYVSCNLLFSKLGKQLSNYHPAIEIIKSENSCIFMKLIWRFSLHLWFRQCRKLWCLYDCGIQSNGQGRDCKPGIPCNTCPKSRQPLFELTFVQ